MARRKNTKRIDPRYFLNETVDRGEELEEEIGRLDRADEPPGGWPTSRGPRKRALGDPVPGGEEDEEDRDLLAMQHDATEEQEAWRDSIEEGWKEFAQGAKDVGRDVTKLRKPGTSKQIRKDAEEARRLDAEDDIKMAAWKKDQASRDQADANRDPMSVWAPSDAKQRIRSQDTADRADRSAQADRQRRKDKRSGGLKNPEHMQVQKSNVAYAGSGGVGKSGKRYEE